MIWFNLIEKKWLIIITVVNDDDEIQDRTKIEIIYIVPL